MWSCGQSGKAQTDPRYDKVLRQKPNQGHEAQSQTLGAGHVCENCQARLTQVDVTVLAVACNNVVALRSAPSPPSNHAPTCRASKCSSVRF